jgi:hypothetical protein
VAAVPTVVVVVDVDAAVESCAWAYLQYSFGHHASAGLGRHPLKSSLQKKRRKFKYFCNAASILQKNGNYNLDCLIKYTKYFFCQAI